MGNQIQEDLSHLSDEELEQSTLTLLHLRRLAKEQDMREQTVTQFDDEMEYLSQRMFSHKRWVHNVRQSYA